ncbi:transporter substrate-binding domain-containing protein [Methylobacterium oryzihabitans]|uniref:Transporter substrate-binding domain-containing protein n=1 Tax=Methylobacterium oryzihabitans TaxID=2499852 RepID=A0A3S2WE98_9HYPH|nr:transporter substrate-binding domain-containing protein [Methylobacterium oryzihabitans]RVU20287.1 transporter substrate-binding domain-containing protein [Methylobacterium oryzihabitans]
MRRPRCVPVPSRLPRPVLAAAVALLFAIPAAADPAPVRIATEGGHPPFNYVEDGRPAGFEVDLAEALCRAAGLSCTIVLHQWDGIVRGLEAGEYDAIMASLAITPKREARIAFTRPYYRIPVAALVRRDAPAPDLTPAGLAGRGVGVAARSPAETYLEQRAPKAEIRPFDSLADAILDLRASRVDLVLGDKLELARFAAQPEGSACCRLAGDLPPGDPILGAGIGVGLRKDDGALRAALDRALAAVLADGTYDRIRAKYVPFDTRPGPTP